MASRGINKVIILGNLGNDPETRYMPNGNAMANISVATSETWNDKQTGQPQERTEWHRIVAFGRLAEIMGQYLRKGSKVYVEGRIQTRKWQDQSGQDRYTTEIIANEMQMLDSRQTGGAGEWGGENRPTPPPNQGDSGSNSPSSSPANQNASKGFEPPTIDDDDNFGDDIPF